MGDLPSPDVARSMAERVVSGVEQLTNTVNRNQSAIAKLDRLIPKLNRDIEQLKREMAQVMEDYRHGYFCSTCYKSMTELGGPERFRQHIAEGAAQGRHAVPATAEQKAAKENEYQDKIRGLEREMKSAVNERTEKLAENKYAWGQIQQGLNLWPFAVGFERDLIQAQEALTEQREKAAIHDAEQALAKVEAARAHLLQQGPQQKELLDQMNATVQTYRNVLNKARSDAQNRISTYWSDLKDWETRRIDQYGRMSGGLQKTEEYRSYNRMNFGDMLPNFTLDTAQAPVFKDIPVANGFKLEYENRQLGLYFKFGSLADVKLSAGLTAGGDEISTEVKTFLELSSKLGGKARIGVGSKTVYGPDGVTTGTAPVFETEKTLKPKKTPKEEKIPTTSHKKLP